MPDSILIVATAEGPNGDSYVFYLSCELEPVSAAVKTVNLVLLVIVAAMFLAAVVLAPGISGRISRPITRLTENAKQLASGDYGRRPRGGRAGRRAQPRRAAALAGR